MKKKKGFTLAEVLITLGIIGVIAAMTIPTLLQNTNSARFAAQFKKTLSTLSQAALMGQAQYDTDFSMTRSVCGGVSTTDTSDSSNSTGAKGASDSLANGDLSFCGLFNSTLAGATFYGNVAGKDDKGTETAGTQLLKKDGTKYSWTTEDKDSQGALAAGELSLSDMYIYALADGSIFGFNKNAQSCSIEPGETLDYTKLSGDLKKCIGFIDVNGTNPPNVEVSCATASENKLDGTKTCTVNKSGSGLGDIFPIVFHDGTVEPASPAAKTILVQGK